MSAVTRLLIAALGGEGGGVLTQWIVAAARAEGLVVQATSVPGVAQRTGATTYYIELAPRDEGSARGEPVFALVPVPGDVDVVVASELLEAARMVERGFVTPDRTFVLASTHRELTVPEKSARGDGALSADALMRAVEGRSRARFLFDMAGTARGSGAFVNAVVLGALAGLGLLPIGRACFLEALGEGRGAEANLRGFETGFAVTAGMPAKAAEPAAPPPLAPRPDGGTL
ncbi:MAG TPA: 2-oxoacid:acceptor oxidoreductase family protein, partial [Alphaproteobacteria bacterium]|nr:2-oxoacid:acceptor oxidoreductase family protein [Alphaproteobacteria bacterium]